MEVDIKDKLRKILELTNSPVEGEAQAAAAHLQRLLTKYNLDIADLERKGAHRPGVKEASHDLGKAAFKWKLDLAEEIADFYYCYPLVNRYTKTVAFVGRPDNVQSLQMLYAWIIEQIKRIAKEERRKHYDETGEHIDPLRWQVNFGVGAVERLAERLREQRARMEEDQSDAGEVTALALCHKSEISDYLEERGLRRVDGRETKREREYREKRDKENARLEALKETDLEAYYQECPWDRPRTPEQEAAEEKRWKDYLKKEERNRKKRERYIPTGGYREKQTDHRQIEQAETATGAGRRAAEKVNLQPFITGEVPKDKRRIG